MSTWEPVRNILDERLLDEWREVCAKRRNDAWELEESALEEEPIEVASDEDQATHQAQAVVEELHGLAGTGSLDALKDAAKVGGTSFVCIALSAHGGEIDACHLLTCKLGLNQSVHV